MSKFAVQLWSMRDIAEKDLLRAIDVAGEMGWDGVEFAGFFDIPAQKVKEHLQKWNLTPCLLYTSRSAYLALINIVDAEDDKLDELYLVQYALSLIHISPYDAIDLL